MEPLISYSGLDLTLVELILGAALLLLGALVTLMFAGRGKAELQTHLSQMCQQQTELQGRMSQMAEDSAQRETHFAKAWITASPKCLSAWGNQLMKRKSAILPILNNCMSVWR